MKQSKGVLLVVAGAALWGFMGVFVRALTALGFNSLQVAAIRITVAALIFLGIVVCVDRSLLKIRLRDIGWFLCTGLISVLLMTLTYATAIEHLSMSTAAILLYVAPILVMVMSVVFLKEPLTWQKPVSLLIAFLGCVLVTGWDGANSTFGLMMALCSAMAYASYTIFSSVLLKRYRPLTVTTYSFLIAAVGILAVCDLPSLIACCARQEAGTETALWMVGCGLETAVLPFLLYTLGLRFVGAGKAAVLSYVEPMVATLAGLVLFSEPLTVFAVCGILLIVGAVVLLNSEELFSKRS